MLSLFVCNVMFLTVFMQYAGVLHHEICFFLGLFAACPLYTLSKERRVLHNINYFILQH